VTTIAPISTAPESATATMRAMSLAAPQRADVITVPCPEVTEGQVRVRMQGSGICASSIPVWQGRQWFTYPQEPGSPGHEGWGVVDTVGSGVTGILPGQRVAVLSQHAFAEFDVAPASQLVPLPSALDSLDFPAEPLGCAMNAFARADVQAGQVVAIIGVGFLGAILARLAVDAGARVIALSRRSFAVDVGRRMGAHHPLVMDDHWKLIESVKSLTGGVMCDRVIECTGEQWPLDLAGELTRERGRLVIAGFHQDGPRQVNMFLWNWRGLDVINAHERDPEQYVAGMRAAVDAVVAGTIPLDELLTHRLPLDQVGHGFQLTIDRPDGFLKAVVTT
jgi:threonine dehydrogenase-like Zn-dependent dehydrogenase